MNKIIDSEILMPQIDVEMIHVSRLMEQWQGFILRGAFWRLYWNSSGGAGVYVNGVKKEFFPDRLYVLPPECSLETWCGNPEAIQLFIHFGVAQYLGNRQSLCLDCPLSRLQAELKDRIMLSFQEEPDTGEWQRNLWGLSLVSEVLTSFPLELLNEQNADRRFMNVCQYLKLHFHEEIHLHDLARQVNMSINTFVRKFRELYLTTPYQYLQHVRYVHAGRLLMTGQLTLKEIATAVGIRDSFQFSRGFKAVYGASPSIYYKRQHDLRRVSELKNNT